MTVLLVEPHLDDAVLFACYTLLQENPFVLTVLGQPEEVTPGARQREHAEAMGWLNLDNKILPFSDRRPNWPRILDEFVDLRMKTKPALVYAPRFEEGGHEQHNEVARRVEELFGPYAEIRWYMTYVRGGGRSRGTTEIAPAPGWPAIKLRAMSYYASQIEWVQTRPWFAADDALREWLA